MVVPLVELVVRVAQQNQMFAMNRQQADEDPNVITGTSNIFDYLALVLIDPGATHSCLSP